MTEQLHSHHWSAILQASPTLKTWTETQFLTALKTSVQTVGLTPISQTGFTFAPHGVSVVVLLAESHVALHYWPEKDKVTVDIHICDYQQTNRLKAEQLTHLLTQWLSETSGHWHRLSLTE